MRWVFIPSVLTPPSVCTAVIRLINELDRIPMKLIMGEESPIESAVLSRLPINTNATVVPIRAVKSPHHELVSLYWSRVSDTTSPVQDMHARNLFILMGPDVTHSRPPAFIVTWASTPTYVGVLEGVAAFAIAGNIPIFNLHTDSIETIVRYAASLAKESR